MSPKLDEEVHTRTMATTPGFLTDWPWTPLGNFKYILLAPWAIHATYQLFTKGPDERDVGYALIFPYLLVRMLHNQIWISYSRYRTAKGTTRIVDKGIDFDQVDRERNWDDHIILNGLLFYIGYMSLEAAVRVPFWRTDGIVLTALLHMGPVEFLYYWFHRALHHHFLYNRYHSHHHSSIATEPITAVTHPFGEHIVYFMLFAIPLVTTILTHTASIVSFAGYIIYVDFVNNMGHCNFEHIPKWLFTMFPPLKYLMYTPSFHSLHHTQFRTNYSLFMPIYDYIYGTTDKSSDVLYENSLKKKEESPDVVYLTHLTTPESIYHLRLGFASLASEPYESKWYLILMWPVTLWSVFLTWVFGQAFINERNIFDKLKLHSWVIPRYNVQYFTKRRREAINGLIEEAVLEADKMGVKVLTLGLLNQGEELNSYGEMYVQKHPKMKVKVVDGSSLAVAVVLNSIPKGTTQLIFRGHATKVATALAFILCGRGIQVNTLHEDEYEKLKFRISRECRDNLVYSSSCSQKIWLVGDGLTEEEQSKAPKGTLFIPFSQFPPKKMRKDCIYHTTPALVVPKSFQNLHACENWLPRMVMSAWRVGGAVHALEGWEVNECGQNIFDVDIIWEATLRHGFRPLKT